MYLSLHKHICIYTQTYNRHTYNIYTHTYVCSYIHTYRMTNTHIHTIDIIHIYINMCAPTHACTEYATHVT